VLVIALLVPLIALKIVIDIAIETTILERLHDNTLTVT